MFEEFLGLPAHPLLVHAAVVLVPLLSVVSVVYALAPALRSKLTWALVALAVVTPVAVWLAGRSGEAFESRLASRGMLMPELAVAVDEHQNLANTLLWWTLALSAAALLVVALHNATQAGRSLPVPSTVVAVLGALVVLGLGLVSTWYIYRTGHTGAEMVWDGL